MKWGIIGAMEMEIALLREKMEIEKTEEYFGMTFYQGTIGNASVVLVQSGIGKINAAICATTLILQYQITHLINVGIAGSLSNELTVLDTVISDEVAFHDISFPLYETISPKITKFPADKELIEMAIKAIENQKEVQYKVGRVVTGDDFVESDMQKNDIVTRLSPLCVEMEGAAIAHAAYIAKVPFVILRTISDEADDSATTAYDNFSTVAAEQSANILLEFLRLASQKA